MLPLEDTAELGCHPDLTPYLRKGELLPSSGPTNPDHAQAATLKTSG